MFDTYFSTYKVGFSFVNYLVVVHVFEYCWKPDKLMNMTVKIELA